MSIFSVLIAIALLLALTSWLTGYRLPIQLPPRTSRRTSGRIGGGRGASSSRPRGVSRSTRKELLGLVGGNAAVAQRLVSDVQARNPGRPEQWCWEKAIYDIERDRRA